MLSMITSLRLINWKSHHDSSFKFTKGINLLVGIMGSGKSSVLDAICFALFGTFPALERGKVKIADLVNFRNRDAGSVIELELEIGADKYGIKRVIKGIGDTKKSDAFFYKNGSLVDKGVAGVNALVEKHFGIDYDLYTRAIYSAQNEIDYFLNLPPRKRKEEIDRLLGLDRFELARGNLVAVTNRVKYILTTMQEESGLRKPEELKASIAGHEAKHGKISGELARLRQESDGLSKRAGGLKLQYDSLAQNKKQYEQMSQQQSRATMIVERLESELRDADTGKLAKDYEEQTNIVESYRVRLADIRASLKTSQQEMGRYEKEAGGLERELSQMDGKRAEVELLQRSVKIILGDADSKQFLALLEQETNKMIGLKNQLAAENARAGELRKLEGLPDAAGTCPVCKKPLSGHEALVLKKEREFAIQTIVEGIKSMEHELMVLTTSYKIKKDCYERARSSAVGIERLQTELLAEQGVKATLESLKGRLEMARNSRELLEKEAADLDSHLQKNALRLGQFSQVKAKFDELDASKQALLEAGKALAAIDYSEKEFESVAKELGEAKLSQKEIEGKLAMAAREAQFVSERLVELRAEMARREDKGRKIEAYVNAGVELNRFKEALGKTQMTVRGDLIGAFNEIVNELWPFIYPYRDYTQIRLNVTDIGYTFEAFNGEWKSFEVVASGGEKACLAMVMRVAFAIVLAPAAGWLILDEPTHNLDKEAIFMFSEALQNKIPGIVNQTFVITHETSLLNLTVNKYRLAREKELNEDTAVEVVA
ncbi:hypothetical protein COT30_03130 [Candidatus Micrarchaeota archaeon CG08_land_8_20_14_0_20_49_17]|nr:MAG: hypothetical protein AUJ13_02530 [Candidatus Micrarchaeota archaeon CG1_02_49_24]PIU09702.1 MAG: hypothetical protein COT30_03130 [Candidatus Micrarchaeota archaeon CG08_land_8_20_14_0_20_49_17]PIZ96678.1 MAG: hypothetical protein COX84_03670 [Candidatus Micrarchaeota archaeon CG_4_10_14_0_2_um_filter_49_7]